MHSIILALALGQAAPSAATPPVREVTVVRRPDGGFDATLSGEPVAGAAFYRAVLRPDLADRYDLARNRKVALGVAAVAAPLLGLTAGWIAGSVSARPPPSCIAIYPAPPNCAEQQQENAQWNEDHLRKGLVVGGLSGLAVGAVFGWLSWRIDLPEPTAEEAEALARSYRERNGLPPQFPSAILPPSGSLRVTPTPGGALLVLSGRF